MTLEEIVQTEGRQPDCCGYVTKYDIECSDGLTIRQGAFVDDDGKKVPMVWMHDHKDLENVLGHVYLESRDDGIYGYGYMNDSPRGQLAKLYVDHGDISAFSIYANKLKKKSKDVIHGMIREVSLVLAGANRGAIIDGPIAHSDDETETDGYICMGEDYSGPIYGNDEALSVEDYIAHYGRKGMKWGKNIFAQDYIPHPRETNITGEGKPIGRKGEGLGTGPVNGTGKPSERDPRKTANPPGWHNIGVYTPITGSSLSGNTDFQALQDQINANLDAQDNNFVTENIIPETILTENIIPETIISETILPEVYSVLNGVTPQNVPKTESDLRDWAVNKVKEMIPRLPKLQKEAYSAIAQSLINGVKAKVNGAVSTVGDKAKESWSFVTDSAKNAKESVGGKVSDVVREIKGNAENAKAELKEKAEAAGAKIGEGAKRLTEKIEGAKANAKAGAQTAVTNASNAATNAATNAANGAKNTGYRLVKNAKETWDKTKDAVQRVNEGAKTAANTAKEVAGRVAEGAKTAYNKAAEEIQNAPENAKRAAYNAGAAVRNAAEGAKSAYNTASNSVRDTYNKASEGVKNAANAASDTAKETYAKAAEGAKEALDNLKDLGEKALNSGKEIGDKAEDILKDAREKLRNLFKHDDLSDDEADGIIMHYLDGDIDMDDILSHADKSKTYAQILNEMSDEQLSCVYYMLKKARTILADADNLKHSEMEDDEMKHNVFDSASEANETVLSHSDMEKLAHDVFSDAKSKGSLKDAFLAHADDYGIDNIEYLFPEDRNLNNPPAWIKRPDGWVSKVMKGVHHSPFSRIKSMFADITEADARARGYTKGNRKVEEVFGLLKRSTSPTTVYKKQKLDRDDIIDITDFNVVSWLKTEMRGMLDEELARAFLVSDGRSPASNDKINEQNIRPIWTDDDLFTIHKAIATTASTTTDELCKQFIRTAIKARKDYKGSGNPTLFTTEDMLADMLLLEDQIGHALYETQDKLAAKLRVKEIVTVPVFENLTRISSGMTMSLLGIIVNLDDYNVGADKGGSVSMFEDFDIDYNQEKYLIETRCSGALTKPYSAIVIESTSSIYLDVDADDPTETRYSKSVATLQSDVVVNDDSIGGTLKYVTGYTGYSEDTDLQSGNYLSIAIDAPSGATTTVKMLNNGGVNETEETLSNDYYVAYVKSKNARIVVTTTLAGVSVSKTYSLRLLKLEKA